MNIINDPENPDKFYVANEDGEVLGVVVATPGDDTLRKIIEARFGTAAKESK